MKWGLFLKDKINGEIKTEILSSLEKSDGFYFEEQNTLV